MKQSWVIPAFIVILVVLVTGIAAQFSTSPKIIVSGTIRVSPEVAEKAQGINVFFVTVFDQNRPFPPYGSMRELISIEPGGTEREFFVTPEKLQLMNEMTPMPMTLKVKVRLDRDGQGGQDRPGDITQTKENVQPGTEGLQFDMTRIVGQED